MDCSMPGFPVLHCLLKFTRTQVHWVDVAIQPSHPLLYPSPPVFNPSQHQGLFQWVSFFYVSGWCRPTISSSITPFSCPRSFPAWVISNELVLPIGWPKYWSFSFSICPSNEYSGLISFRMDWFDLLVVSGTLSRVFSSTTVWKHQFLGTQPSLWPNAHIRTSLLESP